MQHLFSLFAELVDLRDCSINPDGGDSNSVLVSSQNIPTFVNNCGIVNVGGNLTIVRGGQERQTSGKLNDVFVQQELLTF